MKIQIRVNNGVMEPTMDTDYCPIKKGEGVYEMHIRTTLSEDEVWVKEYFWDGVGSALHRFAGEEADGGFGRGHFHAESSD